MRAAVRRRGRRARGFPRSRSLLPFSPLTSHFSCRPRFPPTSPPSGPNTPGGSRRPARRRTPPSPWRPSAPASGSARRDRDVPLDGVASVSGDRAERPPHARGRRHRPPASPGPSGAAGRVHAGGGRTGRPHRPGGLRCDAFQPPPDVLRLRLLAGDVGRARAAAIAGRRFALLAPDGVEVEATEAGTVRVPLGGVTTPLRVRRIPGDADESDLEIYFRDATSGHGSYPAGRFVSLTPLANGRYRLDFNSRAQPLLRLQLGLRLSGAVARQQPAGRGAGGRAIQRVRSER